MKKSKEPMFEIRYKSGRTVMRGTVEEVRYAIRRFSSLEGVTVHSPASGHHYGMSPYEFEAIYR